MRRVCAAMGALLVLDGRRYRPPLNSPPPHQHQDSPRPPRRRPQPPPPVAGQPTGTARGTGAGAAQPRTFTAPVGLLFNTVRADRVDDFEKAMGYLQAALAASTDERVRAQAAGWRIFKATEGAPGGAVLYVFVLDPTVVGCGLQPRSNSRGRLPDQAKLQEIWKLYSSSVTGGSSAQPDAA